MIPSQQQAPNVRGFPPVFTNLTIFVLSPIAAIAITMKNLLKSFNGLKNDDGTPIFTATVVNTDAAKKYKMKNGKIFFILNFL